LGIGLRRQHFLDAAENVQIRFKSSPFGRQSHGHDPHNSFTLNAYGDALLVNCVYRDWHGSDFHTKWCWSTKAHNAMLVNGEGQKPHSPDPFGNIVAWDFQEGADYAAESTQSLALEQEKAGVMIHYSAPEPLCFRQWSGYEPEIDEDYLESTNRPGFPMQWHLEASTSTKHEYMFVLTVLRLYRKGQQLESAPQTEQNDTAILLRVPSADDAMVTIALRKPGVTQASISGLEFTHFAIARKGEQEWRLAGKQVGE